MKIVIPEFISGNEVIDYKCDTCGEIHRGHLPIYWHTFTYNYKAYFGLHEEEELVEHNEVNHVCSVYCYYSLFEKIFDRYKKDSEYYRTSLAVIDGFSEPFAEKILHHLRKGK